MRPFILLALCLMAVVVGAQVPQPSYQGSAAIINSTLYYFGGRNSTYSGFPTLFSLSLTSSFSTAVASSVPWRSRSSLQFGVSESASWTWEGKLWQEGGIIGAPELANAIVELNPLPYDLTVYNPVTDTWSAPTIPALPFTPRRLHAAVVNETKGIAYLVGGASDLYSGTSACGNATGQQCLQVQPYALDLNQLSWAPLSSVGAPMVWKHAMVLVNAIIYVIGGDGVTLDSIPTYNTIGNVWSQTTPVGSSPPPRAGCTAVLHPDNVTIIMYGGWDRLTDPSISVPLSDLWAFNTKTNVWNQIIDSGATPDTYQTSVIVRDQMFVMFGSTQNNATLEGTQTFFFINVTNGQVSNDYHSPTTTSSTSPTPPTTTGTTIAPTSTPVNSGISIPIELIVGIAVGIAVVVVALVAIIFFLRWRRRRGDQGVGAGGPSPRNTGDSPRVPYYLPVRPPVNERYPSPTSSTIFTPTPEYKPNDTEPTQKPHYLDNMRYNQDSSVRYNQGGGMSYNQGGGTSYNQGGGMSYNQGGGMGYNQGGGMGYNQGGGMSYNQGDGMSYNQDGSRRYSQGSMSYSQDGSIPYNQGSQSSSFSYNHGTSLHPFADES